MTLGREKLSSVSGDGGQLPGVAWSLAGWWLTGPAPGSRHSLHRVSGSQESGSGGRGGGWLHRSPPPPVSQGWFSPLSVSPLSPGVQVKLSPARPDCCSADTTKTHFRVSKVWQAAWPVTVKYLMSSLSIDESYKLYSNTLCQHFYHQWGGHPAALSSHSEWWLGILTPMAIHLDRSHTLNSHYPHPNKDLNGENSMDIRPLPLHCILPFPYTLIIPCFNTDMHIKKIIRRIEDKNHLFLNLTLLNKLWFIR